MAEDIVLVALYLAAQVRLAAYLMNTRVVCLRDSPLKSGLMAAYTLVAAGWMAWSAGALWAASPAALLLLDAPMTPGRWTLWAWVVVSLGYLAGAAARSLWLRAATRANPGASPRRAVVALPLGPTRGLCRLLAAFDDHARLEIVHHEWRLPRLPQEFDGLRIVHISDLHHAPYTAPGLDRTLDEIERLEPDLVVMTGDLVTDIGDLPDAARPLSRLRAPLGAYAVTGNHDWWADLGVLHSVLDQAGVRLLRNEHLALRRDGAALHLAGVDDLWSPTHDLAQTLDGIPEGGFTILLAHNPDEVHRVPPGHVDLVLCGHAHGGQVTLPVIGPLVVPCHSAHFAQGLHRARGTLLYVNRGLGASTPFRFRCKPELTHITLRAGAGPAAEEG